LLLLSLQTGKERALGWREARHKTGAELKDRARRKNAT
jgi:hypothetical protein